ncbi:PadR family transcriptional regulator [Bacteroidota bacterium]
MQSTELLKGTLQTIILNLLSNTDRMYGYEITQHVKELSNGKLILTEGALYPTLHKLEAEGLVNTEQVAIGKRVRKYYRLTKDGNSIVKIKLNEFREFVNIMNQILYHKPAVA